MGLKSLVDKGLLKAWNYAGDLKTSVTFVLKERPSFNFNDTDNNAVTETEIKVEVVLVDSKKQSRNTETKEVMFLAQSLSDVSLYDAVVIDDVTWKIVSPIKKDGYVLIIKIAKEKSDV